MSGTMQLCACFSQPVYKVVILSMVATCKVSPSLVRFGVQFVSTSSYMLSLVPRPSTPPVFDRLQYAQAGGIEGLGTKLALPVHQYEKSDHMRLP